MSVESPAVVGAAKLTDSKNVTIVQDKTMKNFKISQLRGL